jgi:hypothetical protein
MPRTSTKSLLEELDEDLKIVLRQSIGLDDTDACEERLAHAALLRLRVAALEQRIEIVRQLTKAHTVPIAALLTASLFAFGAGWLARSWY